MKKIKLVSSIVLAIALIVSGVNCTTYQVEAANLVSGNYEYTVEEDGTVEIVKYNGSEEEVTIPEMLDSKKVTSIKFGTFENNKSLKVITIPEDIKNIDFKAFFNCTALEVVNFNAINCDGGVTPVFKNCEKLTTVNIGPKVTKIGTNMFAKVPITNVNIPSSVKEIEYEAFRGSGLEEVTIPENVEGISFDAFTDCASLEVVNFNAIKCNGAVTPVFKNCEKLTTVNIGPKVTKIGTNVFAKVPITDVNIPSSVKEIEYEAFRGSGLKEVTIPENVEGISFDAFTDCASLEVVNFNAIKCNGAVTPVFKNCEKLTTVNIGPKVTKIGTNMFAKVPITDVKVPANVKEIGYEAFRSTALKTISLPESLTDISFDVFKDCNNLTDVYYAGAKETWAKINVGSGNDKLIKANIHYGKVLTIEPTTIITTPDPTKVTELEKAKITKVNTKKKSAKKVKLSLKKINKAKGYQVAVYTSKKTAKNDKNAKKALVKKFVKNVSVTVNSKKLKNKKKLYIKVRAYALDGNKKVYGKWSTVKQVKIKK